MAATLEEARAAKERKDQAAASAACSRVTLAASKARAAADQVARLKVQAGTPSTLAAQDKALPLLILMEFEARAISQDTDLTSCLRQAAAAAVLPSRCYLTMA